MKPNSKQRGKGTGTGKGTGRTNKCRREEEEAPRFLPIPSDWAYGFDYDASSYKEVESRWGDDYDIALFGRLGIQCHNLQMETNYKFVRWEKYSTAMTADFDYYITLEAMDPARRDSVFSFQTLFSDARCTDGIYITWRTLASRVKCNERLDDEFDEDASSINDFYKGEMPKWLSDDYLASGNKKYYAVQESELRDNDWLQLLMEIGFFSKAKCRVRTTPPLEIKKVVIETHDDYITEAHEKLKAENAIFYISYKCNGDSLTGDQQTIIRKTMDGKPGHMTLEVADEEEL